MVTVLLVSVGAQAQDVTIQSPQASDRVGINDPVEVTWDYSGFDEFTGLTGGRDCEITFTWDGGASTDSDTVTCEESGETKTYSWARPSDEATDLTIEVSLQNVDGDSTDDSLDSNEANGQTYSDSVTVEFDALSPRVAGEEVRNQGLLPLTAGTASWPDLWFDTAHASFTYESTITDLFLQSTPAPRILWNEWGDRQDSCDQYHVLNLNAGSGTPSSGQDFSRDLTGISSFGTNNEDFGQHGHVIAFNVRANDTFRNTTTPGTCGQIIYGFGIDTQDPAFTQEISASPVNSDKEATVGNPAITWYGGNIDIEAGLDSTDSAFDPIVWQRSQADSFTTTIASTSSPATSGTYSINDVDTTTWADGRHYLSLDITDLAGNNANSDGKTDNQGDVVNLTAHVDNTPPDIDTGSPIYFSHKATTSRPFSFPVVDQHSGVSSLDNLNVLINDDDDPDTGTDDGFVEADDTNLETNRIDQNEVEILYRNESLDPGHKYEFRFENLEDEVANSQDVDRTAYIDKASPSINYFTVWVDANHEYDDTSQDNVAKVDDTYWLRNPSAPNSDQFNISVESNDPDPDGDGDESDMAGLGQAEIFDGSNTLAVKQASGDHTSDEEELTHAVQAQSDGITGPFTLHAAVTDQAIPTPNQATSRDNFDDIKVAVDNADPDTPAIFGEDHHVTSGTPEIDFWLEDTGSGPDPSSITLKREDPDANFGDIVDDKFVSTRWLPNGTLVATYQPDPSQSGAGSGRLQNTTTDPYVFSVSFADNVSANSKEASFKVTVDWSPIIKKETGIESNLAVEQDGSTTLQLRAEDTFGGDHVQDATVRFVPAGGDQPAMTVEGSTWVTTFDKAPPFQEQIVWENLSVDLNASGHLPLGEYKLSLEVTDQPGGTSELVLPRDDRVIEVLPQSRIMEDPKRDGDDVTLTVWARFHGEEGTATFTDECTNDACRVSFVEVEGLAKDGSNEEWISFDKQRFDAPEVTDSQDGTSWWEYAFDINLDDELADTDFTVEDFTNLIRVRTNATFGGSADEQFESVRDLPVGGPDGGFLQVKQPKGVNATGNVTFTIDVGTLPATLDPQNASVQVKLQDTVDNPADPPIDWVDLEPPDTEDNTGNWTLHVSDVPSDARNTDFFVSDDDFPHQVLNSSRFELTGRLVNESVPEGDEGFEFTRVTDPTAIQRQAPQITIEKETWIVPAGSDQKWIPRTVDLQATVNTSYARLPSLDRVHVAFLSSGPGWVVTTDVDWSVTLEEAKVPLPDTPGRRNVYELRGNVSVVDAISHGQELNIHVNATDNTQFFESASSKKGRTGSSSPATVKLDARAPVAEPHAVEDTNLNLLTHNRTLVEDDILNVSATDEGTGFTDGGGDDFVRIAFLKENETGVLKQYDGSAWVDAAETNDEFDIARVHRDDGVVFFEVKADASGNDANATAADVFAEMRDTPRTPYFVRLNASDQVGNLGTTDLVPVHMDVGRPLVHDDLLHFFHDGDETKDAISVNWGNAPNDPGNVTTNVSLLEDSPIDEGHTTISYVLDVPGLDDVRRVNVTDHCSVSGTESGGPDAVAVQNVTCSAGLTGTNLSHVGTYRLGVVATDAVGNVGGTLNATDGTRFLLNFTVEDTIAPQVNRTCFDPDQCAGGDIQIGPETNARARVVVFDDGGVKNASVLWENVTDENNVTRHGPFDVTDCIEDEDADDTRQVICTDRSGDHAAVDLGVGDRWRAEWTVFDETGKTTTITSDAFEVLEAGAPFIERLQPPTGANFVGTDDMVFRVETQNLDTVTVEATPGSNPDNLTAYPESNWTVESNDEETVHFVNITPADLSAGSTWTVRVNATNVLDLSTERTATFDVDKQAPSLSVTPDPQVDVAGQTWVSTSSAFAVDASDNNAGLQAVEYSVNGGDFTGISGGSFTIDTDADSATVEVRAVDNAGNEATETLDVQVDGAPPAVTDVEAGRTVEATVTDQGVGLDANAVVLHYRAGDSGDFTQTDMTNTGGDTWAADIPSNIRGQINFFISADDLLANTGQAGSADTPRAFGTQNQAPTLTVQTPSDGATIGGDTLVEWSASDPDGDPVTMSFALDPDDGTLQELLTGVSNTGSTTLDLSGVDDGDYTLVVRASDGSRTARAEIPVSVLNRDVVTGRTVPGDETSVGEEIRVEVEVDHPFRTVTGVTGIIERNGETVAQVPMERTDEGTYLLTYTTEEPGSYNVSVSVSYAEAGSETFRVASFTAAGPVDAGLVGYLVALVLLGGAVVGMGGYGAFGRWSS